MISKPCCHGGFQGYAGRELVDRDERCKVDWGRREWVKDRGAACCEIYTKDQVGFVVSVVEEGLIHSRKLST